MSDANAGGWADRRGLFQSGKAVHEPAPVVRRPSIPKAASPPASPTAATGERRRSSVSGSAGMFANLHSHKRGSVDYATHQQNVTEMNPKGALGSLFDKVLKK